MHRGDTGDAVKKLNLVAKTAPWVPEYELRPSFIQDSHRRSVAASHCYLSRYHADMGNWSTAEHHRAHALAGKAQYECSQVRANFVLLGLFVCWPAYRGASVTVTETQMFRVLVWVQSVPLYKVDGHTSAASAASGTPARE